eukprot:29263-Pelagococcus_subviridis.AAC.6
MHTCQNVRLTSSRAAKRENALRNGVHRACGVVWGPVSISSHHRRRPSSVCVAASPSRAPADPVCCARLSSAAFPSFTSSRLETYRRSP